MAIERKGGFEPAPMPAQDEWNNMLYGATYFLKGAPLSECSTDDLKVELMLARQWMALGNIEVFERLQAVGNELDRRRGTFAPLVEEEIW